MPNGLTWSLGKIRGAREVFSTVGDVSQFVYNGKYSISKMYKYLKGEHEKVAWKRLICNNKASPKSVFILWLAIQNRLATKDRLLSWNIPVDGTCCLCQQELETTSHIFFDCSFSKEIWETVLKRIGQK